MATEITREATPNIRDAANMEEKAVSAASDVATTKPHAPQPPPRKLVQPEPAPAAAAAPAAEPQPLLPQPLLPQPQVKPGHAPRSPRGARWARAKHGFRSCTACGYPRRALCCFGCSYTTRAVFIGSGGVMAGLTYLLLLCGLLICSGTSVLGEDPYATAFLILGVIYLPMGLTLIYSAQTANTLVLVPWLVLNYVLAALECVAVVLAPIQASRLPTFCGKGRIAIAAFVLQVFIVGCRCYCIAVVTHYRHKLLAAKAELRTEASRPLTI